jgi:uncharacterized protein
VNLLDTNVWLALRLDTHTFHEAARDWFSALPADGSAYFCRATQQSLLRLLTTNGMMRLYGLDPQTNADAWRTYESFRADARIGYVPEPDGIDELWPKLAARATASPKLWMDAYLAAFAIKADLALVTTDAAFNQFDGLNATVLKAR